MSVREKIHQRRGESGQSNGPDKPPSITVPDCKPFPVSTLPESLALLVQEASAAADCDPTFVAMPCLALIASTIGGSLCICPKRGWYEPAPIWAVVIADSGTGKSPGQKLADDIVRVINRELRQRYNCELARYLQQCEELAKGDEQPEKPKREYFGVKDITFERLAENLASSPRGLVMNRDELADWFHSFARYKAKGAGTDAARWIGVWNADDLSIERKSGDNGPREIYVERPTISVYGGIQPDIFKGIMSEESYITSGLASRLLLAYLPKRCPRYTDNVLSDELQAKLSCTINVMRTWPGGQDRTPYVGLDYEAKNLLKIFTDSNAERAEGIVGGPMAAVLPKMNRHALRLALAIHAYQCAESESDPVKSSCNDDTMLRAISLARWFTEQAERVYAMREESSEDRDLRHLAELVRRKGGSISPRDLMRSNNRRFPTAETATLALETLVGAGLATCTLEKLANKQTQARYTLRDA